MTTKEFLYEVTAQLSYGGCLDNRITTKKAQQIIGKSLKDYTKYILENAVGILATTGNPELDSEIALNEIDDMALEIIEYINQQHEEKDKPIKENPIANTKLAWYLLKPR